MSNSIKWTPKQIKTLRTSVAKYNAKLTREIKKNPELAEYFPKRKNVLALQKSITSANELQKEVRAINRLFKSGALTPVQTAKGIKTTRYEIQEIDRLVKRVNQQRQKELDSMPVDENYTGMLGAVERNTLKPKIFNPDMLTEEGWNSFVSMIEFQASPAYQETKYQRYKDNYLKAVEKNYGQRAFESGYYEFLMKFPAGDLARAFYTHSTLDLQFHYSLMDQEHRMRRAWSDLIHYATQNNIPMPEDVVPQYLEIPGGIVDTQTGEFFPDDWEEDDIFDF